MKRNVRIAFVQLDKLNQESHNENLNTVSTKRIFDARSIYTVYRSVRKIFGLDGQIMAANGWKEKLYPHDFFETRLMEDKRGKVIEQYLV